MEIQFPPTDTSSPEDMPYRLTAAERLRYAVQFEAMDATNARIRRSYRGPRQNGPHFMTEQEDYQAGDAIGRVHAAKQTAIDVDLLGRLWQRARQHPWLWGGCPAMIYQSVKQKIPSVDIYAVSEEFRDLELSRHSQVLRQEGLIA